MEGVVMEDQMLSTVDNPFNPFHQFKEWHRWDIQAGYHTAGYLARIAKVSDDLSEADYNRVVDDAMKDIVEQNLYGVHCRVTAETLTPLTQRRAVA